VEGVLAEHPSVAAVAVVARPDNVMGEVGVAFVVPRAGTQEPSLAELHRFASGRLAPYKLPAELRIMQELPLTSMDKIDRRELTTRLSSR
jgi:acyl-CoA synthetase (AMP-forming)/AMP-acid ligase II